MGVPTVALVERQLIVTLLPFTFNAPVLAAPNVTVLGAAVLSAPGLANCRVPALIVTPPVKVSLSLRVIVPAPALVRLLPAPLPIGPTVSVLARTVTVGFEFSVTAPVPKL